MRYTLNDIFKKQKGFALLTTILSAVLMLILGFTIIWVTTSNFKMTKIDSLSQSAYYIAEAGINYMIDKINTEVENSYENFDSNEAFFEHIENMFMGEEALENFEKNNGMQTEVSINVNYKNTDGDMKNVRNYIIESTGKVGNSKRTVNTVISLGRHVQYNYDIVNELIFYAEKFSFNGTSVNALSGSIVMDGIEAHDLNGNSTLNVSNLYFNGPVKMDGGSASFGSKDKPGNIYVKGNLDFWNGGRDVYGDIKVEGNFRLKDARIHGNVYIKGDLELGWTPEIHKNIYYTGELTAPENYNKQLLDKCIKIDEDGLKVSFEIPIMNYELRDNSWYIDNGYIITGHYTGTIPGNAKMLVDSYKNEYWQDMEGEIVIISKGDIVLRGGKGFTGALIAPFGDVKYSGDEVFEGIIIAKNEIKLIKGGNHFNFKNLSEIFGDDIPVKIDSYTDGGSTENGSTDKKMILTIESKIKEK